MSGLARRLGVAARVLPLLLLSAATVHAQGTPVQVRGVALAGSTTFASGKSFDAVLGSSSGGIVGGGGQVLLPRGIYVEVVAWRFAADGERVFIGANNEVFRLGIPVSVTVTPVELTAGWRFAGRGGRIVPYVGGGWSSYRYTETSQFAEPDEEVQARHGGVHVVGGAEVQVLRWLSVGGEAAWSRVPNALGDAGVAAAFGEDNLGGTSVRVKITIGG
ncbi:MAG: hypothetical protein AB7H88_03000 [Vicinamibacterales bacterium]